MLNNMVNNSIGILYWLDYQSNQDNNIIKNTPTKKVSFSNINQIILIASYKDLDLWWKKKDYFISSIF
jgi:hypothetical protein